MGDDRPSRTCSFELTATEWEATRGTDWQLERERWSCPHDATDGSELCPFHAPPDRRAEGSLADRLAEAVTVSNPKRKREKRRHKQFVGARFGPLDLSYLVLDGQDTYPVDLRHAVFEAGLTAVHTRVRHPVLLDGAVLEGELLLDEARVEGDLSLRGASLEGGASVRRATVSGTVSLEGTRFAGPLSFARSTLESLEASAPRPQGDRERVDLRYADLQGGRLGQPHDGRLLYDAGHATLGTVEVPNPADGTDPFDFVEFYETRFEGFDFLAHRDRLRPRDWDLHSLAEEVRPSESVATDGGGPDGGAPWDVQSRDGRRTTRVDMEGTYRKAKVGAERAGDDLAADQFHYRQMLARRRYRLGDSLNADSLLERVRALHNWIGLSVVELTSGYGVRPQRIVLMTQVLLVLFAGMYLLAVPPGGGPESALEALLTSVAVFTGYDAPIFDSEVLALVAQYERLAAVFVLSLFASAVTQKYTR